jgi:hypothetical protein
MNRSSFSETLLPQPSLQGDAGDGQEIESETLRLINKKRVARFLRGPIPLIDLEVASSLPGKCLAILIVAHHRCALTRRARVTLPKAVLAAFGVGKDSKSKGLMQLERAGLIHVVRSKGKAVIVELASHLNGQ